MGLILVIAFPPSRIPLPFSYWVSCLILSNVSVWLREHRMCLRAYEYFAILGWGFWGSLMFMAEAGGIYERKCHLHGFQWTGHLGTVFLENCLWRWWVFMVSLAQYEVIHWKRRLIATRPPIHISNEIEKVFLVLHPVEWIVLMFCNALISFLERVQLTPKSVISSSVLVLAGNLWTYMFYFSIWLASSGSHMLLCLCKECSRNLCV